MKTDKYLVWYKHGKQKEDFEKEFKEICEKASFKMNSSLNSIS